MFVIIKNIDSLFFLEGEGEAFQGKEKHQGRNGHEGELLYPCIYCNQCDQKKLPNVYKNCPKVISLEK